MSHLVIKQISGQNHSPLDTGLAADGKCVGGVYLVRPTFGFSVVGNFLNFSFLLLCYGIFNSNRFTQSLNFRTSGCRNRRGALDDSLVDY